MYSKLVNFREHIRKQHFNTQNNESTTLEVKPSTLLMVYLAEKACCSVSSWQSFLPQSLAERPEGQSWQTNPQQKDVSRKTSLIWRCSCHVVARPHQAIRKWHIAQSGHFSIAGGLFCFTSAMPTQSSLVPKEKVSTLVIWGLIRYSHRLRIYLSLECALREDPAASEASVNGDPNKECGFWCSWRTATFFFAIGTCQSQWNKSFRCQFSSMFQAVLPLTVAFSLSDDDHVPIVCFNDKKVSDSGKKKKRASVQSQVFLFIHIYI